MIRKMNRTSFLRRGLLIMVGTLSVGLGVAGVLLPLLPATPFFLVAAACYARSSDRLHRRLLANRFISNSIASYQAGTGIPARTKAVAIGFLWITLLVSALLVQVWWIRAILGAVAVGVPLFILSLPTPDRGAVSHH